MKKSTSLLSLILVLSGCSGVANNKWPNAVSPSESGGLEANASNDLAPVKDSSDCKKLLKEVSQSKYYCLEIISNVAGSPAHFYSYYAPHCYLEKDYFTSKSFGFGEEKDTSNIFKFYIDENGNVNPSLYEMSTYGDEVVPERVLYSQASLTHVSLFGGYTSTFSAINEGHNRYLITDADTASIFQYMTTFGYSITNYITATYVDIINLDTLEFKATVSLGEHGDIALQFTKQDETTSPLGKINKDIEDGTIKGVAYHDDVGDFFENYASTNNYVLEGIKQNLSTGVVKTYNYNIHCTENYFYLENTNPAYQNWGYCIVKKGTSVTYETQSNSGATVKKTQKLNYDACYGFAQKDDGSFYFDFFKGPIESDSVKYLEVDELPETGDSSYLYIVANEEGRKEVYEWTQVSNGVYGYLLYSPSWSQMVGDYSINDASASFYLSPTGLCDFGKYFFDKDEVVENRYHATDSSVLSILSNGLFGWGFQATTTWMDYVTGANLSISKEDGKIVSAEIGLDVLASVNSQTTAKQEIYYTMKDFGKGQVAEVSEFLNEKLGGGY